eukprot:scaffold9262_cov107-Cylindrotheca_fusiformis.AAC.2
MKQPLRYLLLLLSLLQVIESSSSSSSSSSSMQQQQQHMMAIMMDQIENGDGFLVALDQSGGSTPRALQSYYGGDGCGGYYPTKEQAQQEGTSRTSKKNMYNAIHEMRSRIMTSPSFAPTTISSKSNKNNKKKTKKRILGVILFEDTVLNRQINGKPTAQFLWQDKQIIPFLKIDQGLIPETTNGVQLMKPIYNLQALLRDAKDRHGIFGTKMRSIIHENNIEGIEALVQQQFDIGKQILQAGLVPILEPEIAIDSPDKMDCEETLKACLLHHLDELDESERVILKLSLPSSSNRENFYEECIRHPNCIRVVALSGGYSQKDATALLSKQHNMIASFSRAFTEGLTHNLSDVEFDRILDNTITAIFDASTTATTTTKQ